MATPKARARRRLAGIAVVDVVEYSRLMGEDEPGTLAALSAIYVTVVRPTVRDHSGRIVKLMGDGALIEFASVVDAVECAIVIQKASAEQQSNVPDERAIRLRIGINLGDIISEGSDIYGDGVNVASRLEALADPGGICISGTVHDHVKGKLDIDFEDLGEHQLKNIIDPVRACRIISERLAPRPAVGVARSARPSLAVLPLYTMSGDQEQQYFADGVSEDLTTALSRFDWLFVAARNSAFRYKGESIDVNRVGRDLDVRYVLEGSVRQAGGRVRLNVQVIDTETLGHIWAERLDREMDDIFELQDEIVASTASTVAPEILHAESPPRPALRMAQTSRSEH